MVECFYRPLKVAIRCHQHNQWTSVFLTVLLGIRGAWREYLKKIFAELVYGQHLRLPGEFIEKTSENLKPGLFARELRGHFCQLRPAEVNRHGELKPFIFKELKTTDYVLVLRDPKRNWANTKLFHEKINISQ